MLSIFSEIKPTSQQLPLSSLLLFFRSGGGRQGEHHGAGEPVTHGCLHAGLCAPSAGSAVTQAPQKSGRAEHRPPAELALLRAPCLTPEKR